jgi:hypothetical protein
MTRRLCWRGREFQVRGNTFPFRARGSSPLQQHDAPCVRSLEFLAKRSRERLTMRVASSGREEMGGVLSIAAEFVRREQWRRWNHQSALLLRRDFCRRARGCRASSALIRSPCRRTLRRCRRVHPVFPFKIGGIYARTGNSRIVGRAFLPAVCEMRQAGALALQLTRRTQRTRRIRRTQRDTNGGKAGVRSDNENVRDGEGAIASTRGACAPQRGWHRLSADVFVDESGTAVS